MPFPLPGEDAAVVFVGGFQGRGQTPGSALHLPRTHSGSSEPGFAGTCPRPLAELQEPVHTAQQPLASCHSLPSARRVKSL